MNQTQKYLNNSQILTEREAVKTNVPSQYSDRGRQYFAGRSRLYGAKRAYLASDYVTAEVQGVTDGEFYNYVTTDIRLSDLHSSPTSLTKKQDDFKEVLFVDPRIDYIPIGAKINTMGSTWIVIDPSNLSQINVKTLVARCNASYNSFDEYGNIVTEPLYIEKAEMLGNDPENKKNIVLMDGYFHVICQLNKNTEKLTENSRIIIGKKAFYLSGVTDFIQEFTGDRESCHLMSFTARVTEPTENDDIIQTFVANAYSTIYTAALSFKDTLAIGETTSVEALLLLNGNKIEATADFPQNWTYESFDPDIATVDSNGVITPITAGYTTIKATLTQNTNIIASRGLEITADADTSTIEFAGYPPTSLLQYSKAEISAALYVNGAESQTALEWSFSGASGSDYFATVSQDGRSAEIECLSPSDTPLIITASWGSITNSIEIELCGY